jgi:hypothetical protein
MILGSLLLIWALRWAPKVKFWLALSCLLTASLAIHALPNDPYFVMMMRHWYQGRLLHFNELMQWVSVIWLPLALLWMIREAFTFKLNS